MSDIVVAAGDRIRISTELLADIAQRPSRESDTAVVWEITIEDDGCKVLWLTRVEGEPDERGTS